MTSEINSNNESINISTSAVPLTTADQATKNCATDQAQPIIPPDIQALFGKPPLLIGEDPALYNRLIEELVLAINPKGILEWLWLKDVADYTWEIFRLQRFKGLVVDLERKRALSEIMRKVIDQKRPDHTAQVQRLSAEWFTKPETKIEVGKILNIMGLSEDCINAQAAADCSRKLTAFDNSVGHATARRDSALREIDRHRAEVLSSPNRTSEIIDSEAGEVVEQQPGMPKSSPKAT